MSYLTKEQIEKKLKQAHAKSFKTLIKYGRKEAAERLKVNNVCSLKWMPRKEQFAIANLTFNPETGTAHSYRWYAIAKLFKGQMILNDYAYSPTTSKHYGKLIRLFKELGIKFSTIKAPKGLDDTERARNESLLVNARSLVKLFHSRGSKLKKLNHKVLRDFASQDIETLKLMGQRVTNLHLVDALAEAVGERESRLERSRERAQRRRAEAEVWVDITPKPQLSLVTE